MHYPMSVAPGNKSFFGSFFSKKEHLLLFLKKKTQKDVWSCAVSAQ
jgi:hypothetical protein